MRRRIPSSIQSAFGVALLVASVHQSHAQPEHRISSFQVASPGQAHLTVTTPPNESYSFIVSSNLTDWAPAGPLPPLSYDTVTATYLLEFELERPLAAYQVAYEPIPPNPTPIAQLLAPANDPVVGHLPDMGVPFENGEEEVSNTDGVPISLAHLLVVLGDGTTVQELNTLLTAENVVLAGAIPEMHLGVLRRNSITTLAELNDLADRLTATGLFDAVALNLGMSPPRILETPLPQLNRVGRQREFLEWTWETPGLGEGRGGNNGLEMSRIPQLWNWLDHGFRQRELMGNHEVAVIEFAFNPHRDLHTNVFLGTSFSRHLEQGDFDHGIAVVGIVSAWRNRFGTEGVTPLPIVRGIPFRANHTSRHAYEVIRLWQLRDLLRGANPPRIINISSGMPWYSIGDPTTTERVSGVTYAEWMDELGALWAHAFENLNEDIAQTDYLIVCSAGNDDGVDAAYNSPMANIACRPELHGVAPQFLTVESISEDRTPSAYSNFDAGGQGHAVSAGGTDVTVLQGPGTLDYKVKQSGTSFAAPLVAGLASFLWSLDPTLTIGEMKTLLLNPSTTHEVDSGERAGLVDGFSAALAIDLLRGNHELQRALVDVDDGTKDGNLRQTLHPSMENPDQIHTEDGRRGDGAVNMKDFRVFRDAWLQTTSNDAYLDGPPLHFKRDLNFDGLVVDHPASPFHPEPYHLSSSAGESLPEKVYSRYDFNGNGQLDAETDSANPPLSAVSPVQRDPDTPVTGWSRGGGLLRDIDVLLDEDIWDQGEENVVLSSAPPYPASLPMGWTTNSLLTLTVPYLQSCDFHLDMDGGTPEAVDDNYDEHPFYPVQEGLEIQSYFSVTKGRFGAWQGVITIPYDIIFDIPTVSIQYRKTQGNELHQYIVNILPEAGEDIGLVLRFDELQLNSSTRFFAASYVEGSGNPESTEVIARTPGGGIYGSLVIPLEEYSSEEARNRARVAATAMLAGAMQFPTALNGTPSFEAIFDTESDPGGVRVDIYGLIATFNTMVATPTNP